MPSGAASDCRATRAPRRPAQGRSDRPIPTATTARDLPRGAAKRHTSASTPPGSGRRGSLPAATPVATVANANQSPPPAPQRPPPAPSAAANRATTKGRAVLAPVPPRLTPLSHRYIREWFCEFAVLPLLARVIIPHRPPPPRGHGGWGARGARRGLAGE